MTRQPPTIFDFEKIRRNRLWARDHMAGHDFLFQKAADRVLDNLADIQRDFDHILIVGERGAQAVQNHFQGKNITTFDVLDGESEIPHCEQGQFDCVIVLPYIHTVNDVIGFLAAMKSYLKPDGLFLCAFFGGQSLQELRESITKAELEVSDGATNHIHPMIDHYQFAGLMQRVGFALPVVDFDRVVVEYADLKNLYKDLKNMGEGNALCHRGSNIKSFKSVVESHYRDRFFDQGYVATFDIIYAIGWVPHESQQQPAKRGSGQVSLMDVL